MEEKPRKLQAAANAASYLTLVQTGQIRRALLGGVGASALALCLNACVAGGATFHPLDEDGGADAGEADVGHPSIIDSGGVFPPDAGLEPTDAGITKDEDGSR